MKVLLVSANNEKYPYPVAPIGAAYIAQALRSKGHDIRLIDLCFVEDGCSVITEALKDFDPDVIGISIRNIDNLTYNKSIFYMPRIRRIVDFIKKQIHHENQKNLYHFFNKHLVYCKFSPTIFLCKRKFF